MHAAIAAIPVDKITEYRASIKNDERVRDLDMRLRWDLMHATVGSRWMCDNVYPYANDTHIDTALKRIVASLGL
jgi:hypothetical protein